jgi:hypothetical protein
VVLMAPTQGGFIHLLKRLDREVLRTAARGDSPRESETAPWREHSDELLPLEGRKLHVHVDWDGK